MLTPGGKAVVTVAALVGVVGWPVLAACRAAMNDMGAMAREVEWLWPTR
jgi:hypothetical protein